MGGLGIKKLNWQNEALGAKLSWRLYKEHNQKWARILYNKYLNANDPLSIFRMKSLPKGSDSWNFIAKSRYLITKYLTWDIGNGQDALFWEDSWDGLPPLDSQGHLVECKNLLSHHWGDKVKDYMILNNDQKWTWKSIENLNLDPTIKKIYQNIITHRPIKQVDREDKLIWAASKLGNYNVK